MTSRREAMAAALALAGLGATACAADKISFDRGAFAIDFEQLAITGLALLNTAIQRNTKAGVPNAYAQGLAVFRDELQAVKKSVEQQILEAPSKSRQLNTAALGEVAAILGKAIPLILPLIAAL